ncbi:MAG: M56 family metallopeptidase, partial [Clostridia bacterium]|nr:M56 family metallopeptidase [Clostridia bacterium]
MEKMFLDFVNVSVSSVWLVLAVLLLRLILKKAPKSIICALWAVVGLRLILPFNIESPISLVPSAEVFPEEFLYAAEPKIDTGFEALDNVLNPVIAETLAPSPGVSANPTQLNAIIFPIIWAVGVGLILIYMLISFLRVKYKVREAALFYENIWMCDNIDTPFILGIIRPKIYVPSSMTAENGIYVIAHEKAHIKRLDYVWKPLGFLVLALHWFNPAMWVAYVMFCRDIEFACDEKVIRLIGAEKKQEYSTALLNLSAPKHIISACPLAFGENGVKARIKGVLNYKKPAFWVILVAVVLAVAAVVAFFAGPASNAPIDKSQYSEQFIECVDESIKDEYDIRCGFDWEIIGAKKIGTKTIIYAWVMCEEYSLVHVSYDERGYSSTRIDHSPTIIIVDEFFGKYTVVKYWRASESENYENDIKAKFPKELWEDA